MLELFTENMEYVDFITSSRSMLSVHGLFHIITDKYTLFVFFFLAKVVYIRLGQRQTENVSNKME